MHSSSLLTLFLTAMSVAAYPNLQKRETGGNGSNIWDKWSAAKPDDVRGPCPALNALANHGLLQGRKNTKDMLYSALDKLSLNEDVAGGLYSALEQNGITDENGAFDLDSLDKHNALEHDGSLSRADAITGDNHSFNSTIFHGYLSQYDGSDTVDAGASGEAREYRIQAAKEVNPEFTYGPKQQFTSLAETAAFMGVLGGPSDPQVPVEWIKVLFEEERLPYNEGWRPSTERVNLLNFMGLLLKIAIDSHTTLEDIGAVTVPGLINALEGLVPAHWPDVSLFGN